MTAQYETKVKEIVTQAVMDFFVDREITAELDERSNAQNETPALYAAVLSFTGEKIRGTVMVRASRALVERTHPVFGHEELKESDLEDWIGEIANRCVGRIKTILLTYGVNLTQAVPAVLKGCEISPTSLVAFDSSAPFQRFDFKCHDQLFSAWFAALFDASVDLSKAPQGKPAGLAEEGDILLF